MHPWEWHAKIIKVDLDERKSCKCYKIKCDRSTECLTDLK